MSSFPFSLSSGGERRRDRLTHPRTSRVDLDRLPVPVHGNRLGSGCRLDHNPEYPRLQTAKCTVGNTRQRESDSLSYSPSHTALDTPLPISIIFRMLIDTFLQRRSSTRSGIPSPRCATSIPRSRTPRARCTSKRCGTASWRARRGQPWRCWRLCLREARGWIGSPKGGRCE